MSSNDLQFRPLTDEDKELFNSVCEVHCFDFVYSLVDCSTKMRSIFDFVKHTHQFLKITIYNQSVFNSNLVVGHFISTRFVLIFHSIVKESFFA